MDSVAKLGTGYMLFDTSQRKVTLMEGRPLSVAVRPESETGPDTSILVHSSVGVCYGFRSMLTDRAAIPPEGCTDCLLFHTCNVLAVIHVFFPSYI